MFRFAMLMTVTASFTAAAIASSTKEQPYGENFPVSVPWVVSVYKGDPVFKGQCTTDISPYFCAYQALKYR